MKKVFSNRLGILVIAVSLVVLLSLLAVSLHDLRFLPGRIIYQNESQEIQLSVEKIVAGIVNIPFWKQAVFWISAFFVVFFIALLFPPELRKRILKYFLRLAVFILALYYIYKNFRWLFPNLALNFGSQSEVNPVTTQENSLPEFSAPQVPPPVLYLVSLLIVVVIVTVISLLIIRWIRKNRSGNKSDVLDDIAEVARNSLKEISAGDDWEDAIIQCYVRMNEAVSTQRGVNRPLDFTPRQFAEKLVATGLPPSPVQRLTELFESVRYGARLSSDRDRKEASACLNEIISVCEK